MTPSDERARRLAREQEERAADETRPAERAPAEQDVGNPSALSENGPGAPEETRGTRGQQGRPRHPPEEK